MNKNPKPRIAKKVEIQDSSDSESELQDILEHPAFNKTKRQQIAMKKIEKQREQLKMKQKQSLKHQKRLLDMNSQSKNQIKERHEHLECRPNQMQSKDQEKNRKVDYQVCLQGLSFQAFGPDIRSLFDDVGKIVKLKVLTDKSGRSKGTAFAKFATEKQYFEALKKDGVQHMGRTIKITAGCKKEGSQHGWKQSHTVPKQQNKSQTLFMGNLAPNTTEKQLASLFAEFEQNIIDIRIVMDRTSKKSKGIGYIEFTDAQISTKAFVEHNGAQINGRHIRLDYANKSKKQ